MTAPVVFIDTETTGLSPVYHEVWEVALIEAGGTEHVWQLPVNLGKADPKALAIGRFHERRDFTAVVDRVTFAHEFAALTRGMHLVGAVVSFDEERLRRLLIGAGACPEWHYHLVDVEALAAGALASRAQILAEDGRVAVAKSSREFATPPWSSEDLSRAVGVDPDDIDRHTALGDAKWAKAIYEAVMG